MLNVTSEPPTAVDTGGAYLITVFSFYIPSVTISLGVIGNTLTFITMAQSIRQKRNVLMSFHFCVLAVGDQLYLVLSVFQRWLLTRFPDAMDLFGWFLCKETLFTGFFLFGPSVWNVVIISIDRFVAVCYPLRASQWCTVKRAAVCYLTNYAFFCAISLVKLWYEYRIGDFVTHTSVCKLPDTFPPWWEQFEVMFYEILVNYVPPVAVLTLNLLILNRFRQQAKELKALGESARMKQQESQERSLTVMMMVMAFTFIILMAYFPLESITWQHIVPRFQEADPKRRELSFYIAYYLTTANQCVNFYLYFLVNRGFRRDVKRLLSCSSNKN